MQASVKANSYVVDRRGLEDQRSFGPATRFPLFYSIEKYVINDRRYLPDRRIASIQVKGHFLHINLKPLRRL